MKKTQIQIRDWSIEEYERLFKRLYWTIKGKGRVRLSNGEKLLAQLKTKFLKSHSLKKLQFVEDCLTEEFQSEYGEPTAY